MGFDVSGHRPKSEQGKYFGANNSGWSIMLKLMALVNSNHDDSLIDPKTLRLMASNDGDGLSGEQASALADAMRAALDDESTDNPVNHLIRAEESTAVRSTPPELAGYVPLYESRVEMARSFCRFLGACGGFSVY